MLVLIVVRGPSKGRVIEIKENQMHIVGRQRREGVNMVWVPDTKVSRTQAELYQQDGKWYLKDLGSSNGTFINKHRIRKPTELHDGDQIAMGRSLLVAGYVEDDVKTPRPHPGSQAAELVEAMRQAEQVDDIPQTLEAVELTELDEADQTIEADAIEDSFEPHPMDVSQEVDQLDDLNRIKFDSLAEKEDDEGDLDIDLLLDEAVADEDAKREDDSKSAAAKYPFPGIDQFDNGDVTDDVPIEIADETPEPITDVQPEDEPIAPSDELRAQDQEVASLTTPAPEADVEPESTATPTESHAATNTDAEEQSDKASGIEAVEDDIDAIAKTEDEVLAEPTTDDLPSHESTIEPAVAETTTTAEDFDALLADSLDADDDQGGRNGLVTDSPSAADRTPSAVDSLDELDDLSLVKMLSEDLDDDAVDFDDLEAAIAEEPIDQTEENDEQAIAPAEAPVAPEQPETVTELTEAVTELTKEKPAEPDHVTIESEDSTPEPEERIAEVAEAPEAIAEAPEEVEPKLVAKDPTESTETVAEQPQIETETTTPEAADAPRVEADVEVAQASEEESPTTNFEAEAGAEHSEVRPGREASGIQSTDEPGEQVPPQSPTPAATQAGAADQAYEEDDLADFLTDEIRSDTNGEEDVTSVLESLHRTAAEDDELEPDDVAEALYELTPDDDLFIVHIDADAPPTGISLNERFIPPTLVDEAEEEENGIAIDETDLTLPDEQLDSIKGIVGGPIDMGLDDLDFDVDVSPGQLDEEANPPGDGNGAAEASYYYPPTAAGGAAIDIVDQLARELDEEGVGLSSTEMNKLVTPGSDLDEDFLSPIEEEPEIDLFADDSDEETADHVTLTMPLDDPSDEEEAEEDDIDFEPHAGAEEQSDEAAGIKTEDVVVEGEQDEIEIEPHTGAEEQSDEAAGIDLIENEPKDEEDDPIFAPAFEETAEETPAFTAEPAADTDDEADLQPALYSDQSDRPRGNGRLIIGAAAAFLVAAAAIITVLVGGIWNTSPPVPSTIPAANPGTGDTDRNQFARSDDNGSAGDGSLALGDPNFDPPDIDPNPTPPLPTPAIDNEPIVPEPRIPDPLTPTDPPSSTNRDPFIDPPAVDPPVIDPPITNPQPEPEPTPAPTPTPEPEPLPVPDPTVEIDPPSSPEIEIQQVVDLLTGDTTSRPSTVEIGHTDPVPPAIDTPPILPDPLAGTEDTPNPHADAEQAIDEAPGTDIPDLTPTLVIDPMAPDLEAPSINTPNVEPEPGPDIAVQPDDAGDLFPTRPDIEQPQPEIPDRPQPPVVEPAPDDLAVGPELIEPKALSEAKRVAFLVDASGSQIDTLPLVIDRVSQTVENLTDNQDFTVIFFQSNRALEVPPAGMKSATKRNHARISQWMNPSTGQILAMGSSNPVTALRLAAGYEPDQIVIFSDKLTGTRPGQVGEEALFTLLDQLTDQKQIQINTVHFFYDDAKETLKRIANRYGGTYEFVPQPTHETGEDLELSTLEIIKD